MAAAPLLAIFLMLLLSVPTRCTDFGVMTQLQAAWNVASTTAAKRAFDLFALARRRLVGRAVQCAARQLPLGRCDGRWQPRRELVSHRNPISRTAGVTHPRDLSTLPGIAAPIPTTIGLLTALQTLYARPRPPMLLRPITSGRNLVPTFPSWTGGLPVEIFNIVTLLSLCGFNRAFSRTF